MEKGEGSRRKGRKFKSGSGEREGGGVQFILPSFAINMEV